MAVDFTGENKVETAEQDQIHARGQAVGAKGASKDCEVEGPHIGQPKRSDPQGDQENDPAHPVFGKEVGAAIKEKSVKVDEKEDGQEPKLYPVQVGTGHKQGFEQTTACYRKPHFSKENRYAIDEEDDENKRFHQAIETARENLFEGARGIEEDTRKKEEERHMEGVDETMQHGMVGLQVVMAEHDKQDADPFGDVYVLNSFLHDNH